MRRFFAAVLVTLSALIAIPAQAQEDRLNASLLLATVLDANDDSHVPVPLVGAAIDYEFASIFRAGVSAVFDAKELNSLTHLSLAYDLGADVGPFGVLAFADDRGADDGWYFGGGAHFDIRGVGIEGRLGFAGKAMEAEDEPKRRGRYLGLRFIIF